MIFLSLCDSLVRLINWIKHGDKLYKSTTCGKKSGLIHRLQGFYLNTKDTEEQQPAIAPNNGIQLLQVRFQSSHLSQDVSKPTTFRLPIIRQGSSGSIVRILQQLLNFKGFRLEVNGQFDLPTQKAVKDFQEINDLAVDGIVNAKTWYYLSADVLCTKASD